jgi:hypothetical protein
MDEFSESVSEAVEEIAQNLPSYWVVVVDDTQPPPPELHQFHSFEELADFMILATRERKTAWLLPLFGNVLRTAEGLNDDSLRFLVHHDGRRIPLFDADAEIYLKAPGFYSATGVDYINPADPQFQTGGGGGAAIPDPSGGGFDEENAGMDYSQGGGF